MRLITTRTGMHVREIVSVDLERGIAMVLQYPATRTVPFEFPLDQLVAAGGIDEIIQRAKDFQKNAENKSNSGSGDCG